MPIAVQVAALLSVALFAALALAIAIMVLLPLPPPAIYRLSDIAASLSGNHESATADRVLVRQVQAAAPVLGTSGLYRESRIRLSLAELLGAPLADVKFFRKDPGRLAGFRRPQTIHPQSLSDALIARADVAEFFDEFLAAYRRPDGQWVVVQPRPDPMPSPSERRVLLWLLCCLLLIAPTAWWFASRITAPISHFAKAADRLRCDPKAPPISLSGAPELRAAAAAFNEMQFAIQRYVDDRTMMCGAISHDLRTPLSRLRFKLENPAPNRSAMLSDLAQMDRMISSILEFVRQESQLQPGEPLELRSLLECVTDAAGQTGGDTAIADGEPLYVHGDVSALQRLFNNLVENALRYGCAASITAWRNGEMAEVEVNDAGPGLPENELEAVFRPFYRSDTARNMDKSNPQAGVGLGLSISRAIARAHGGDVTLRRNINGLTARVSLPLLQELD